VGVLYRICAGCGIVPAGYPVALSVWVDILGTIRSVRRQKVVDKRLFKSRDGPPLIIECSVLTISFASMANMALLSADFKTYSPSLFHEGGITEGIFP
jgi:hypothetical protein